MAEEEMTVSGVWMRLYVLANIAFGVSRHSAICQGLRSREDRIRLGSNFSRLFGLHGALRRRVQRLDRRCLRERRAARRQRE
jgi:hypothetical protein